MTMQRNTYQAQVLAHMQRVGSISIREAMDDYGLSGGSLTKYVSNLKKLGHVIKTETRKHPISGRRYARYHLVSAYVPEAKTETEYQPGDKVILTDNFPGLTWGKGSTFFINRYEWTKGNGDKVYSFSNGYFANTSVFKRDTSLSYQAAA